MSGHSKWAQIKRKKAVTDAARSGVFSKFARLIAVESKKVGGVVSAPSLRAVINRAKVANMPKEKIERAIAKGCSTDTAAYEYVLYETYSPGGVAVLINTLTDNRNRTAQEIKLLLSEHGCVLAAPGSARWIFTKNTNDYSPNSTVELRGDGKKKLSALLDAFDECDYVQEIYTNAA